jgi:phage protein D
VNGRPLRLEQDAALTKVDVDLDVDFFGRCVLSFTDPKLALIDGNDFRAGVAVKVELGFHTRMKKIFEGEVVALEPKFQRDKPPFLDVICFESLHRLALSQHTRAFNAVDDRQIVTRIAREHGLSADAPRGTQEHALQSNVSDATFLRRLAQKQGNHLRIDGRKLIVGPPPRGGQVTITPGDGVKKMKVSISAKGQVSEVAVHGWDSKAKQPIVATARGVGTIGEGARQYGGGARLSFAGHEYPAADVATAEKMARGRMRKLAEGFVKAQVEMIGNPEVVPGHVIIFDKLGERIDGKYRVEHARHEFSKRGYFTALRAVLVAKKPPARPAPAQRPQPPPNWIEIELKDESGRPLPGTYYQVKTPDGRILDGNLDGQGKARVEGVKPGQCKVSFPEIHETEWRPR